MKDTKKKDNFKTIVISSITLFGIIVFILVVCVTCGRRGNNNNKGNQGSSAINISEYINEDEFLDINMDDFTLYVDDIITLSCYSNPPEYADSVNWSSSDNNVLTVAFDGTVTAISEGIAAVTVTYGVLTDSIIIKVISEEASIDEEFPMYNPEETKPAPTVSETTAPIIPTAPAVTTPAVTDAPEMPTTTAPTEFSPESDTKPTETKPVVTEPVETSPVATTPAATEPVEEDVKDVILNNLPQNEFSVYLENTYVFKEDGNYLGQVIVTENFTQIYVMTRTTHFDSCLKSFLQTVLPTGYLRAFDNLATATSDKTFYVDGYKVRAVASPNGGHSQLIIYYK